MTAYQSARKFFVRELDVPAETPSRELLRLLGERYKVFLPETPERIEVNWLLRSAYWRFQRIGLEKYRRRDVIALED